MADIFDVNHYLPPGCAVCRLSQSCRYCVRLPIRLQNISCRSVESILSRVVQQPDNLPRRLLLLLLSLFCDVNYPIFALAIYGAITPSTVPDLKLICFTNPFLHSLSGSIWTVFADLGLGTDLQWALAFVCFCSWLYFCFCFFLFWLSYRILICNDSLSVV